MIKDFSEAGFTKEFLTKSPEKIFIMLLTAAYDRRPFTGAAGGYEYIWGIRGKERGLPLRLLSLGLSNPVQVGNLPRTEIKRILKEEMINGYPLDSDGYVDYSKTILDVAFASESLHEMFTKARNPKDASMLYHKLNQIHGIGETIAAKILKYLLREIAIGNIEPHAFPLSVVWPLVDEYHNEQAIIRLRKIGSDVVPLTMGLLLQKGDPFAIDALFYFNRYEPRRLEEFVSDVMRWRSSSAARTHTLPASARKMASNKDKAKLLLDIIKDV